jgi:hypothetical protein
MTVESPDRAAVPSLTSLCVFAGPAGLLPADFGGFVRDRFGDLVGVR